MRGYNKIINLLIGSLLCYTTSSVAAEKWYRVEVLVFETKDQQALAEEWPLDPGKPSLSNAVNLVSDPQLEFGQLSENNYALADAKARIRKKYHLVLHTAWRQMGADKEHAQKVHLVGGKDFGTGNEIDGTFRLTAGRYLHVDADFLFNKPMKVIGVNDASQITGSTAKFAEVANRQQWQSDPSVRLQSFRLKESSRMRLDEIQYIDHPMYGVLIMVTPEKAAEKTAS